MTHEYYSASDTSGAGDNLGRYGFLSSGLKLRPLRTSTDMRDPSVVRLFVVFLLASVVTAFAGASPAAAQTGQGLVIDQTGLPLPGAMVQLMLGDQVVTTVITAGD